MYKGLRCDLVGLSKVLRDFSVHKVWCIEDANFLHKQTVLCAKKYSREIIQLNYILQVLKSLPRIFISSFAFKKRFLNADYLLLSGRIVSEMNLHSKAYVSQ